MQEDLLYRLMKGDTKALARCISLVENEHDDHYKLLKKLPHSEKKIIGITGPPGAGKSTLVDSLIGLLVNQQERVAVKGRQVQRAG